MQRRQNPDKQLIGDAKERGSHGHGARKAIVSGKPSAIDPERTASHRTPVAAEPLPVQSGQPVIINRSPRINLPPRRLLRRVPRL